MNEEWWMKRIEDWSRSVCCLCWMFVSIVVKPVFNTIWMHCWPCFVDYWWGWCCEVRLRCCEMWCDVMNDGRWQTAYRDDSCELSAIECGYRNSRTNEHVWLGWCDDIACDWSEDNGNGMSKSRWMIPLYVEENGEGACAIDICSLLKNEYMGKLLHVSSCQRSPFNCLICDGWSRMRNWSIIVEIDQILVILATYWLYQYVNMWTHQILYYIFTLSHPLWWQGVNWINSSQCSANSIDDYNWDNACHCADSWWCVHY